VAFHTGSMSRRTHVRVTDRHTPVRGPSCARYLTRAAAAAGVIGIALAVSSCAVAMPRASVIAEPRGAMSPSDPDSTTAIPTPTATARCEATTEPTIGPVPGSGEERRAADELAQRAAEWQGEPLTLIQAVKDRWPHEYATARLNPPATFEVWFTGTAPSEALTLLSTSQVPHTVVEHAGFTEAQALELNMRLGDYVSDLVPPGQSWSNGPDPFERTLDITIWMGDDDSAGQELCRSIDTDAIAATVEDRLATDIVETYGFTVVVDTGWGETTAALVSSQPVG
jgi:hypothetical protein